VEEEKEAEVAEVVEVESETPQQNKHVHNKLDDFSLGTVSKTKRRFCCC
jgi:hypothetical protein